MKATLLSSSTFSARPAYFLLLPVLLGVMFASQAAMAQVAAGAEWTTPAGTIQGTRFSSLTEINTGNVSQIREEFHFVTGVQAGHE